MANSEFSLRTNKKDYLKMEHTQPASSLVLEKKDKEAIQMIKDHIVVAMGIEDPRFDEAYLYRYYILGKKNVPKVRIRIPNERPSGVLNLC